jgi:hypothetical protein
MPGVLALALTKSVAPDNDMFMFRSVQKHIKIDLFWFNQRFSTKKTMKKVCYFYIYLCFSCRFTIICLKKVFLNTNFYFVYNIYISEKCMTQMDREYIRDLFSLLQLHHKPVSSIARDRRRRNFISSVHCMLWRQKYHHSIQK